MLLCLHMSPIANANERRLAVEPAGQSLVPLPRSGANEYLTESAESNVMYVARDQLNQFPQSGP